MEEVGCFKSILWLRVKGDGELLGRTVPAIKWHLPPKLFKGHLLRILIIIPHEHLHTHTHTPFQWLIGSHCPRKGKHKSFKSMIY